jgi:hypothetical protein
MSKLKLRMFVAVLAVCALVLCLTNVVHGPVRAQAQAQVTCAQWASSSGPTPPTPNVIDSTCAVIPPEFKGVPSQYDFDLYSWVTFLAVNWPAGQGTCAANTQQNILTTPPNPVWTTYLQDSDVFVPSGQTPANWCFASSPSAKAKVSAQRSYRLAHLPPKVRALAKKHPEVRLFLHQGSKTPHRAALTQVSGGKLPEILQATGDILVDQNGRWTRFTVAMNSDEYGYIMSKTPWTKAGQASAGAITFPATPTGAMEFKSAWKILGAGDDATHLVTASAIVYNDESSEPSPGPNPVTVGLVGLHITHKTALEGNWIWSTFEQVENDTKSFFNPSCSASTCPPNQPTVATPGTAQELNSQGKPNFQPAQVVAVTPPEEQAQGFNKQFQALLKGTPWAYYQLISTQWVGEAGSAPKPAQLGNSVQETFTPVGSLYSCMTCHSNAVLAGASSVPADFSFLLTLGPQQ